jgi:ribonuclease ZC3H12
MGDWPPRWKQFRLVKPEFWINRFMPPDDPMGRNGPTLDAFLRRSKYGPSGNPQPCPYEKKCTYGNKCKFFHADRGNQPQVHFCDFKNIFYFLYCDDQ